jgi:4-amino-4-deoxy-L-arabinose transferase-like glycosyltransferase
MQPVDVQPGNGVTVVRRAETAVGLAALVVALVAAYARMAGLSAPPFGGDERYIVLHALKFGTGDLNPHFFDWPASPLMYGSFGAYAFYYAIGRLAGWFHSGEAFGLAALFTPDAFYLVPRLVSAVSGGVGALAVWRGLAPLTPISGRALAAAAVLAAPIHIEFSRLGLADVPMTAAVAVVAAIALRLADEHDQRSCWIGAAMVGIATSLKYQGALSAFPLALGVVLGCTRMPDWPRFVARRLAVMAVIAVGTFVVLTPFAALAPREFLADLTFQFAHQSGSVAHYGAVYPAHPVRALLTAVLPAAFGWAAMIGAVAGAISGLVARQYRPLLVLLLGVMLYAAGMLESRIMAQHYALPMLPFLAMLASLLCVPSGPLRIGRLIAATTLLAMMLVSLEGSVRTAFRARLPTTERAVVGWLMSHTPAGAAIAMEDSLPIVPTAAAVEREIAEAAGAGLTGRVDYWNGLRRLVVASDPATRQRQRDTWVLYDADDPSGYVAQLEKAGVCTVVRFDRNVERFTRTARLPGARERLAYYRELASQGDLVAEFRGGALRGPRYAVYHLRGCAESRRP